MVRKNIKLDDSRGFKNRIPVLVNDENWLKIFGKVEDRAMKMYRTDLEELLMKQQSMEREVAKLKREKSKAMKKILKLSDEINNEKKTEYIALLDEHREKLIYINETIDELVFKLETIPGEIKNANFKLLEATIEYAYTQIKEKEEKLKDTGKELERLREKMRKLASIKRKQKQFINDTYTFMHRVLGNEQIEELDSLILERKD